MNASRVFLTALFAATVSLAAQAQSQGAPSTAAPAKAPTLSKKEDCQKANAARHDHGKEKGGGSMAAMPCPPAAPASAAKANKPHNHGTFHKNQ